MVYNWFLAVSNGLQLIYSPIDLKLSFNQNRSLGCNVSKLKSPKNPKYFSFFAKLEVIYLILQTHYGYQNRSKFIKDQYSTNTNPNQTKTEAGTPFFHPKNSLKVKYLQFPSAQDFRLYSSWIYGQNALGICWKSHWTIQ